MKNIIYNYLTVERGEELTSSDNDSIIKFYLPLLGSESVTLYNFLSSKVKENPLFYFEYNLETLYLLLNTTKEKFENSRKKLEAIGLFKTFNNHKDSRVVISIKRPLNREEINKNTILKNALYNNLGKEIVDNLLENKAKKTSLHKENFEDISAHFLDVFADIEIANKPKSVDFIIGYGKTIKNELPFLKSQNNIELKTQLNLINSSIENEYEALLKYNNADFFKYLTKTPSSELEQNIISQLNKLTDDFKIINLVMLISFLHNNGSINWKQINSILNELNKRNISNFEASENYLDGKFTNSSNYKLTIAKKNFIKTNYLRSL
ncbi:DnaD domain protein [Mycoplasmopsis cricetuli]|uniref:DnaD domain protein n=1 Tax=Mycoplasmopsis cricetuli TaxID=171283 RepID=UPI00046E549E|nr:DnaD domain protein [Mycoplasmopsis cricetuli]